MQRTWERLYTLQEAIERTVNSIRLQLEVVEKDLWDCNNSILAEDIIALHNMPPHDRSTVDGYAVIAEDTFGASVFNPVRLRVKGLLHANDHPEKYGAVNHGEAIEVYTGAPIPPNANAVIMYEDTRRVNNYIEVYRPVSPGENISKKGEDFKKGDILVKKNTKLKPWHLSAIASQGLKKIKVFRPLKIGILSTGNELLPPGSKRTTLSYVYASTEYLVKSMLDSLGFTQTTYYGIIRDDLGELSKILAKAFSENDFVITIAGTSVGRSDIIPDYVENNGEWIVRGIAIRPGKTTSTALVDEKPLFSVSGNIVAAWTAMEAYIIPTIHLLLGIKQDPKPMVEAILTRRIPNTVGYRTFVRTFLFKKDDQIYAKPFTIKGSNIYTSLIKTHGYIVIEETLEGVEAGEKVKVYIHNPF